MKGKPFVVSVEFRSSLLTVYQPIGSAYALESSASRCCLFSWVSRERYFCCFCFWCAAGFESAEQEKDCSVCFVVHWWWWICEDVKRNILFLFAIFVFFRLLISFRIDTLKISRTIPKPVIPSTLYTKHKQFIIEFETDLKSGYTINLQEQDNSRRVCSQCIICRLHFLSDGNLICTQLSSISGDNHRKQIFN